MTNLFNSFELEDLIHQLKNRIAEEHPGYYPVPWWDLSLEDNKLIFSQTIYDPNVKGSEKKYSLEKELNDKI